MSIHQHDGVEDYIRSGGGATVWVGVMITDMEGDPMPGPSRLPALVKVYESLRREGVDVIPGNMDTHDVFSGTQFYLRGQGYKVARAVASLSSVVKGGVVHPLPPSRVAALQAMAGA